MVARINLTFDSESKNTSLTLDGQKLNDVSSFCCDKFMTEDGWVAVVNLVRREVDENGDVSQVVMSWSYKLDSDEAAAFEIIEENKVDRLFSLAGIKNA